MAENNFKDQLSPAVMAFLKEHVSGKASAEKLRYLSSHLVKREDYNYEVAKLERQLKGRDERIQDLELQLEMLGHNPKQLKKSESYDRYRLDSDDIDLDSLSHDAYDVLLSNLKLHVRDKALLEVIAQKLVRRDVYDKLASTL